MVSKAFRTVYRWGRLFSWGWGGCPRPRWWEAYMLHARFEVGVLFDILAWRFGIELDFRYMTFELNLGPVQIWADKP